MSGGTSQPLGQHRRQHRIAANKVMVERRRGVQPDEDQEHVGGQRMKIVELPRQRAVCPDDIRQMKEK